MSDLSPDIPSLLAQFARRYRHRLLARAGILIALGLACLGLLAGRLQALALGRVWVLGLPGALALIAAAALGWRLRRSWISRAGAASHLDQAFGLQQRLVTAAEFARVEEKSSLYPLLIEDAARRLSSDRLRTPRPFTRAGAALALALLLLLVWPGRGRMPIRLAQLPMTPPPTSPPPPKTSDQRPETGDRRPETSGQSQHATASHQQSATSTQGTGQSKQKASTGSREGASPQNHAGSADQHPADPTIGQDGSAAQDGASHQPSSPKDKAEGQGGNQSTPQDNQRQGKSGMAPEASGHKEERQGSQPQAKANQPQQAGAKSQASQASAGSVQPGSNAQEQNGPGDGQATMAQEAMQSQIRQLLKEVSGELQELQAKLAKAQEQPNPAPGTSTDPELYGSAAALDRSTGAPLSIQLDTDTAQTQSRRPGGGVGKPSGDVSADTPQVLTENAQLSDAPLEETPEARQPLPPDYRGVFDRLRRQPTQANETKSP